MTAPKAATDPVRNAELALIHTARRRLALSEDSYRAIIGRFSARGAQSSADLTAAERRKVIEYFRSIGFDRPKSKTVSDRRADFRPRAMKLKALWYALYQLGVVRDPSQAALESYVRRQTGIEVLRWNDGDDLARAIDCLKAWCQRVGYDARPFQSTAQTPQDGSFKPGLIQAQWRRLRELGAFERGVFAGLDTWLRNMGMPVAAPQFLSDEDAEEAIRRLGHWLRRLSPANARDGDD